MKSQLFSTFMIFGFLAERYFYSYNFSYLAAVLALAMLVIRASNRDLIAITALFVTALCSDLSLIRIEIRYLTFVLLFLVSARCWCFDPRILFGAQLLFLSLAMANSGVAVERFVFGVAVSALLLMVYLRDQPGRLLKRFSENVLFAVSLFVPLLGYGSRAALAIWLVVNWRVTVVSLPVATISISLFLTSFIVDIPVFEKALSTFDELFTETPAYAAMSLRALENFTFFEWVTNAPEWQLILGSGYEASLPGYIIGDEFSDFSYIPHAFVLGVFFQFGLLGLLILSWRLYHLIRSADYGVELTVAAFTLLLMGVAVKHGFFDTDLIMLFAALNAIARRRKRRQTAQATRRCLPAAPPCSPVSTTVASV